MEQITFSEIEFAGKRKRTSKERFFEKMEKVLPLKEWCGIIEPHYYKKGNGRQATDLTVMVKMLFISKWFNLSDEQTEDMLNENLAARKYAGVRGDAPDATTLCKFRKILQDNDLYKKIFDWQGQVFVEKKVILKEGTLVDATIIESADTPKTKEDESVGVTRKNGRYYVGHKLNVGVDKGTNIIHSVKVTSARVTDIEAACDVLHGEEKTVHGDAAFTGIANRADICEKYQSGEGYEKIKTPRNRTVTVHKKRADIEFIINKRRKTVITEEEKEAEKEKSRVRIFVEHVFCKIKYVFGYRRTRYKGLAKNQSAAYLYCLMANLLTCSQKGLSTK
jgi:IS5 family transposase